MSLSNEVFIPNKASYYGLTIPKFTGRQIKIPVISQYVGEQVSGSMFESWNLLSVTLSSHQIRTRVYIRCQMLE